MSYKLQLLTVQLTSYAIILFMHFCYVCLMCLSDANVNLVLSCLLENPDPSLLGTTGHPQLEGKEPEQKDKPADA